MMNAYDSDYVYHAQKNFAHMVDFAVNTCDYDIDEFFNMFLDKSAEYWLGWSLCYYAWKKNYKFAYILKAVSAGDMIGMYDTLHEADITKYVSVMDERLLGYYTTTSLTRIRNEFGISQAELARRSGVNVRVIQSYEQRLRDINKAQIDTVSKLAHALECKIEDLIY